MLGDYSHIVKKEKIQLMTPAELKAKLIELNNIFIEDYNKSNDYFNSHKESILKILELFSKDHEDRGKVLLYHSTVEYFIDQYIKYYYSQEKDYDTILNLVFKKKLAYLNKTSQTESFLKSLKELNHIRNNYAHDIYFKLSKGDISNIIFYLKEDKNMIDSRGDDYAAILKEYAVTACGHLTSLYGEVLEKFREKQSTTVAKMMVEYAIKNNIPFKDILQ